jgi:hypothetical protein
MLSQIIIFATSAWCFSWLYTHYPTFKTVKTVPLLHAVVSSVAANYILYYEPYAMTHSYKYTDDMIPPFLQFIPVFSLAYGIYDLYDGIQRKDLGFILHGSLFMIGSSITVCSGNLRYSFPGILTETSTIFLQFIHFPSLVNNLLFASTFFLYRNILFPYISFEYFREQYDILIMPNAHYVEKTVGIVVLGINALNFFWARKIYYRICRMMEKDEHESRFKYSKGVVYDGGMN